MNSKKLMQRVERLEAKAAERQHDPRPPTVAELRAALPGLTEDEATELAGMLARPIERLDGFELCRLMFLHRAVGPSAQDAPASECGNELGGRFNQHSSRACYRRHLGEPVPGRDYPVDALGLLTEHERRRLDEIKTANPGIDIRELLRQAMASRDGKVTESLSFMGSPGSGTYQLQHLLAKAWHRYRTGGLPAATVSDLTHKGE
jgi:hypothetical protein